MKAVIPSSPRRGRFLDANRTTSRVARFAWPWLLGLTVVIGVLLVPSLASASVTQEEQTGSRLLGELESGKLRCAEASGSDFDHIGEYVMGRMFGSPRAHEAMNNMMSTMMGAGSEQQTHEAMGRRFAGCGGGRLPAGFGRMMGAVNAMGTMGGGMMGGVGPGGRGFGGPGNMMGGLWSGGEDNGSDGPSAAAMIATLAVLIIVAALALAWFGLRRRRVDPVEVLKRRYAAGELNSEEYRELRDALS
jgi:uncharacterized membrane protein